MPAPAILLIIGAFVFGAFFWLTFFAIRSVTRRDRRERTLLPNDGHTADRAQKLQEESERYRNLLADQLFYESRGQKGRRR